MVKLIIKNKIPELKDQYDKIESELNMKIIPTRKILFIFENMDIMVPDNAEIIIDGFNCKIGDKNIDLRKNKFLESIPQVY